MLQTRRLLSALAFALGLLVVAGCGQTGATVKGTLVLPPKIKVGENDYVQVTLVPEKEEGEAAPAQVNLSDMSFTAKGPTGKGVHPGNYKVAVSVQLYNTSNPESEKLKPVVEALNKQYDSANTKLRYAVTNDPQQSITVDLTKGEVTK